MAGIYGPYPLPGDSDHQSPCNVTHTQYVKSELEIGRELAHAQRDVENYNNLSLLD
jgi:hypothetical protein